MRAIILAGGKGSRLAPYTAVVPKPLMPVGDLPILEIVIRQLRAAGVTQVTLAVNHLASLIMAVINDGDRFGLKIDYSLEEQPLGTAGPIALVVKNRKDTSTIIKNVISNLFFTRVPLPLYTVILLTFLLHPVENGKYYQIGEGNTGKKRVCQSY